MVGFSLRTSDQAILAVFSGLKGGVRRFKRVAGALPAVLDKKE
jgi:hypothetical protein